MSKRDRRITEYRRKLTEIYPQLLEDKIKRHPNGSYQRISGKRVAKKMAKLGLELEKL